MSTKSIIKKFWIIDEKIRYGNKATINQIVTAVKNNNINCTIRTIHTDLVTIADLWKQPILNEGNKYFYKNDEFSINNIKLNDEDLTTFEMLLMNSQNLMPTGIYEKYNKILDKMLSEFAKGKKAKNLSNIKAIQPEISYGNKGYEWIEPIFNAIINKEAIEIIYQKAKSEPEKKIISPYILKEHRNRWYCVGYDHLKRQTTNIYSLDRMRNVEYSAKPYWIDSSFDYDSYFKYSLGIYHFHNDRPINVKLEFYGEFIETVQNHPLMPTQKSKLTKRGKALEVELEVYNSKELVSEILKYGELVKVVAPENLAKTIKEKSRKITEQY
jgi:predicted DNA-binding transcriptional regulator YafY